MRKIHPAHLAHAALVALLFAAHLLPSSSGNASGGPAAESAMYKSPEPLPSIARLGPASTLSPVRGWGSNAFETASSQTIPGAVASGPLPSDTDTAHYSYTSDGSIQVQLYNSPVGLPDGAGWRFRDPGLVTGTNGTVSPAWVPFDLHIATSSTNPSLAAMSSEDGVGLQLALAPTVGTPMASAVGHLGADGVTYTGAFAGAGGELGASSLLGGPADLVLHPTIAGLDARIVIHDARQAGPFAFALTLDPRMQATQGADGTVMLSRSIPLFSDKGHRVASEAQPEYVIQAPVALDSSPVPSVSTTGAPASLLLGSPIGGGAVQVDVRVDPAWLADPRRVFPVQIDLPVATATAALHTGLLGTVNSCDPSSSGSPAGLLVGQLAGCTFHGQLYFDVSSLWAGLPIAKATLNLFTPAQLGPTGVQLEANLPPTGGPLPFYDPVSWQPSSWDSAPLPAPNVLPIDQNASLGHWQQWDVTTLARSWVNDRSGSNGGLTLVGSGAPVRFSSPLVGDSPQQAPSLTIVLGRDAFAHPANIFGLAGSPNTSQSNSPPIHPAFTRIQAVLGCGSTLPDWSTAYAQVLDPRVTVPLLLFVEDYRCGRFPNTPADWQTQLSAFVAGLGAYADAHGGFRFATAGFEIGNEPDTHADFGTYPAIFAVAAQTLHSAFPARFPGVGYTINTGGVVAPVAQPSGCAGADTFNTIRQALAGASQVVPSALLGIGLHPFSYATGVGTNPNLWLNYRQTNTTGNPCFQLDGMINLWQSSNPGSRLLFTEMNYSTELAMDLDPSDASAMKKVYNAEGSYLVDLDTWLYNRGYASAGSPVSLFWFNSNDFSYQDLTGLHTQSLGLYTRPGADKSTIDFATTHAPGGYFPGLYCPLNSVIHGSNPSFAVDFAQSSMGPCYTG